MLVLVGQMLGVKSRTVTPPAGADWEAFEERTATVLVGRDGTYAQEVRLAGKEIDVETLPRRGEVVAFEVSYDARLAAATDRFPARVFRTIKAWRRAPEVEAVAAEHDLIAAG